MKRLDTVDCRQALIVAGLLALACLAPAPASAAPLPAVDEYITDYPDAQGKKENAEEAPLAKPRLLPDSTAEDLAKDPRGQALIAIATAKELGAPTDQAAPSAQVAPSAGGDEGSGGERSVFTAAGHALGAPAALVPLGAVTLLVLAGIAILRRSRTSA